MGADNLQQFHHWQRWQGIAQLVPIAVIDREPAGLRAAASPAAHWLAPTRIADAVANSLPERRPPAWIYLHGLKSPISSTALRNQKSGGGRLNPFTTPDYLNGPWAAAQGP